MNIKLKAAILNWLVENPNAWQRINSCVQHFRPYIYDANGHFLMGGEEVHDFICDAEKLIYRQEYLN